jgi:hypothetical protein
MLSPTSALRSQREEKMISQSTPLRNVAYGDGARRSAVCEAGLATSLERMDSLGNAGAELSDHQFLTPQQQLLWWERLHTQRALFGTQPPGAGGHPHAAPTTASNASDVVSFFPQIFLLFCKNRAFKSPRWTFQNTIWLILNGVGGLKFMCWWICKHGYLRFTMKFWCELLRFDASSWKYWGDFNGGFFVLLIFALIWCNFKTLGEWTGKFNADGIRLLFENLKFRVQTLFFILREIRISTAYLTQFNTFFYEKIVVLGPGWWMQLNVQLQMSPRFLMKRD